MGGQTNGTCRFSPVSLAVAVVVSLARASTRRTCDNVSVLGSEWSGHGTGAGEYHVRRDYHVRREWLQGAATNIEGKELRFKRFNPLLSLRLPCVLPCDNGIARGDRFAQLDRQAVIRSISQLTSAVGESFIFRTS